jgi:hypothetical protein
MSGKIVHIDWDGPFSIKEVQSKNGKDDYGVYQIYGNHPIYGYGVLLYIGKAVDQTFGQRINQEEEKGSKWLSDKDYRRVEIYTGTVDENETGMEWETVTDLVEKLLIYSHQPACNSSSINSIPDKNSECPSLR